MKDPAFNKWTVLVTGAASGIGRAVAEEFFRVGARTGALDRTGDDLPAGCHPVVADLQDAAGVMEACNSYLGPNGTLDALVHCAGVNAPGGVEDGSEEEWKKILDINILGQMRLLRATLPALRRSRHPSVVLLSSCSAINGIPQRALYSASKGGMHSMGLSIAADLVHEGIRVNLIAPATVNTPMMDAIIQQAEDPARLRRDYENRQPTGRMIQIDEVVRGVFYLCHPDNHSLTGTCLEIDGGLRTIRHT